MGPSYGVIGRRRESYILRDRDKERVYSRDYLKPSRNSYNQTYRRAKALGNIKEGDRIVDCYAIASYKQLRV